MGDKDIKWVKVSQICQLPVTICDHIWCKLKFKWRNTNRTFSCPTRTLAFSNTRIMALMFKLPSDNSTPRALWDYQKPSPLTGSRSSLPLCSAVSNTMPQTHKCLC